MQATVTPKRVGLGQLKIAAIGIGIVASAALGVLGIVGSDDTATHSSGTVMSDRIATGLEVAQFEEQNFFLPDVSTASHMVSIVEPAAYTRFIEQNRQLPGDTSHTVTSSAATRFIEQNLWLPGDAAPAALPHAIDPATNESGF